VKKVAVVGAGITGLCSAYYLAKAGHQVRVYEAERYAGMKTSFANGGQISVSNSETWTTWSNVKKGFRWMFRKDAPLKFRWRLDWAMWRWVFKFLLATVNQVCYRNSSKTVQMGIESRRLYDEICQDEDIKFDRSDCGILHFYKNPDYWQNAQEIKELYNANGCSWDLLQSSQHVKAMDPALSDIENIVGGTWTPEDWTGDIHKFCYNLAEILETKYGVEFHYNWKIGHVEELSFYDAIVVANGVGSRALAATAGDTIDVYPVKGYSITINNVDPRYLPRVSLLDDEAKIVTATLGNRFRVAGTAELAGENYDITRDRIDPLLKWVHTNFPNINTHDYTQYACLRPMTPDMMPIICQSASTPNVFYNTGHGHLGWTLGPATGKRVADLVSRH
jgi:D-amino-acid dehydrogenase